MPLVRFQGNCPRNVNRDAKYSVRRDGGRDVIALVYETNDGERWYATTDEHPILINMINNVRIELNLAPYGSFYINEFKQVIIPIFYNNVPPRMRGYYYAGEYDQPLVFDFDGIQISGKPVDFNGNHLRPGDNWVGAHQGIPYVLCAGGNDIRYEAEMRPNVIRRIHLSDYLQANDINPVIAQIIPFVGYRGGRFYVNEFGAIFRPRYNGNQLNYVYVGQLDMNRWFSKPQMKEINGEMVVVQG